MNTTTTIRRGFASAVAATTFLALAACGTEVSPPSQDIGKNVSKEQKAPVQPSRTGGPRLDFGDDLGTADPRARKNAPAGSGTRNRLDFRDDGI